MIRTAVPTLEMTDIGINILAQGYRTTAVEETLELARWSAGNALLVGGIATVVGAYAIVWLYRHEGRGRMSARMRWTLTLLRMLVLFVIGFIALEPVLVRYEERRQDATTLVLVDSSASMGLADAYRDEAEREIVRKVVGDLPPDGIRRTELVRHAIGAPASKEEGRNTGGASPAADGVNVGNAILRGLANQNRVKVFAFDRGISELADIPRSDVADAGATSAIPPLTWEDKGSATDAGHAVRRAMETVSGAPIAAIVLLTDGRFNRGESPQQIARMLRSTDVPAYVVGVGDPSPPVNLRVAELSAPKSAFKNDPFRVSARIEAVGLSGETVQAELWERRGGRAEAERVDAKTIHLEGDGTHAAVAFERKVEAPGDVGYTLRLAPAAYEALLSDNERDLVPGVHILDDKMKVLLVSGGPSYDYRYLSRLLERDATVELSTWLQSADINAVRDGNVVLTELPVGTEDINKYDAIVLMDVDPASLDPTWGSILANYVAEYGGGLLFAAGNKSTGQFFRSPKTQPIVAILPIVPDPEAEIIINELGHYQTRVWPIVIPDGAAGDPILRQTDDVEQTRDVWAMLGGVYWHYPVRREKPVARALMRHSNPRMVNAYGPHVLFATQYVGAGRSAYLGINTTWRWRRGDDAPFNRFWIQTLRFLVEGKLLGGRVRGQILTTRDEFEVGDTIVVKARALTETFDPLLLPLLTMNVSRGAPGSESETVGDIELQPVPGRDGHYEGRFQARDAGAYRMTVRLSGSTGAANPNATLEKEVYVGESNIEMRETPLDETGLRAFVEAVGGRSRYLNIAEATDLPQLIDDASRTARHRGRVRPVWDHSFVFGGLIVLLTAEWIIRKVAKLI